MDKKEKKDQTVGSPSNSDEEERHEKKEYRQSIVLKTVNHDDIKTSGNPNQSKGVVV